MFVIVGERNGVVRGTGLKSESMDELTAKAAELSASGTYPDTELSVMPLADYEAIERENIRLDAAEELGRVVAKVAALCADIDDGTGDLGVIVRQAAQDHPGLSSGELAREVRRIVREAREEATS